MGHRRNFQLAIHETFVGDGMEKLNINNGNFGFDTCGDLAVVMVGMALAPDAMVDDACGKISDILAKRTSRGNLNTESRHALLDSNTMWLEELVVSSEVVLGTIRTKAAEINKDWPHWLTQITGKLETTAQNAQIIASPIRAAQREVWDAERARRLSMTERERSIEDHARVTADNRRAAGF